MFNRNGDAFVSESEIKENLSRFEGDTYLTKYLVNCFNPEFEVSITFPRSTPHLSDKVEGYIINKKFDKVSEVF
jgi:hypothetical protein